MGGSLAIVCSAFPKLASPPRAYAGASRHPKLARGRVASCVCSELRRRVALESMETNYCMRSLLTVTVFCCKFSVLFLHCRRARDPTFVQCRHPGERNYRLRGGTATQLHTIACQCIVVAQVPFAEATCASPPSPLSQSHAARERGKRRGALVSSIGPRVLASTWTAAQGWRGADCGCCPCCCGRVT